ncbi:MAG TPA: c-type cytochrome, partial [Steroidobacteraceae bacterium]|nr:c-type cytochrome [Steroidobacteraceae bacterium]
VSAAALACATCARGASGSGQGPAVMTAPTASAAHTASSPVTADPAPEAGRTRTLNPALQAIYERSCRNCHGVPASGAPQAGDTAAWAPRLAQGSEILLEHTFNGYKKMPPLGACMDCTEEQYGALIEYMSGVKPQ